MVNETLILTQNYSSRNGAPPIKFACHTTEGWEDSPNGMYDCAHYFQGDVGASAHYMNDNFHSNLVVAGVYEQYSAWTQSGMNPWCISLEQCALAEWSRDYWLNHRGVLLQTTAALVRQVCDANGIPIRSLNASEAQDSWTKGVCDHVDFGSKGGGHHDCGSGYPMDKIIEWAKAGTSPPSMPTEMDIPMVGTAWWNNRLYMAGVATDGKVKFWESGTWFNVDPTQSGAKLGSASITVGATSDRIKFVIGYVNGAGAACTYECEENENGKNPWRWSSKSNGGVFALSKAVAKEG